MSPMNQNINTSNLIDLREQHWVSELQPSTDYYDAAMQQVLLDDFSESVNLIDDMRSDLLKTQAAAKPKSKVRPVTVSEPIRELRIEAETDVPKAAGENAPTTFKDIAEQLSSQLQAVCTTGKLICEASSDMAEESGKLSTHIKKINARLAKVKY